VNLENYLANFFEKCKIYSEEVPITEINGIINSKCSRSYDDLYSGVTFWDAK